jgi:hypothetical protein
LGAPNTTAVYTALVTGHESYQKRCLIEQSSLAITDASYKPARQC